MTATSRAHDAHERAFLRRVHARVGAVINGKYRLDALLGVGGMAAVYRATHRNDAQFAIKILHPELSVNSDIRSRFLREGKAANSVQHPGVVAVVDDDIAEDGSAFLVMELLRGATVQGIYEVNDHKLPVPAVLSVVSQLLAVLAVAHRRGTVHRDLKPANLFVTEDGTVKVLDFGIARVRNAASNIAGGPATGTGVMLGTPAFMAPEQASGDPRAVDAQTDLWAVGATAFALLTGETVHDGASPAQVVFRVATTPARSVASVSRGLPPAVARVIDKALAFEKAERWKDATTMRDALEQATVEAYAAPTNKAALSTLVLAAEAVLPSELVPEGDAEREVSSSAVTRSAVSSGPEQRQGFEHADTTPASFAPPARSSVRPSMRQWTRRRRMLLVAAAVFGSALAVVARTALHGYSVSSPTGATARPEIPREVVYERPAIVTAVTTAASSDVAAATNAAPAASATSRPQAKDTSPAVRPEETTKAPLRRRPVPTPVAPATATVTNKRSDCPIETVYDEAGRPHFKEVCK